MTRTVFQLPAICHENFHLFLSAFLVSVTELYFCYYYGTTSDVLRYEYITLFTVFLACSLPFTILDPPIWFCIFMTTFSHMLFLKGFYSLTLFNVFAMFAALCIKHVNDENDSSEELLIRDSKVEFV
ncbi:unnamed protein product [Caenorhabditis brenneri]